MKAKLLGRFTAFSGNYHQRHIPEGQILHREEDNCFKCPNGKSYRCCLFHFYDRFMNRSSESYRTLSLLLGQWSMKINCIWSLCFHLLLYVPYTSRCAVPTMPAGAAIECRLSTVFQSCSPWNPLCIIDASMTSVRNENWWSWQVLLCHCTEVKS